MPPTRRPASSFFCAAAASARGKLAPQRMVAGRIAQRQRTISIWNVYHGLVESSGFTGQYGSDSETMKTVHAIATVRNNWQTPKTARAETVVRRLRAIAEPAALPIPR